MLVRKAAVWLAVVGLVAVWCAFLGGAVGARAEEPKAAPSGLTLVVEARVIAPAEAPATLHVKAVFRNAGATALTFFVPESYDASHFPRWRLVREDGTAFAPYDAPFQSMWNEGVQGSLPTLAPGRSWEVEYDVDRVVLAAPPADGAELTPLPLEPGRYRVECVYEKKDADVPVGGKNFEVSTKTVPGLWTGRAEAKPVTVDVPRAKIVSLRLDAPRDALPGKPYVVTVTLQNDHDHAATIEGVFTLSVSSKPVGTASVRVTLAEPCVPAPPGATQALTLAAGARRTFSLDLAALDLVPGRPKAAPARLAAFVGEGIFALEATFGRDPGAAAGIASNVLWRHVSPTPAAR